MVDDRLRELRFGDWENLLPAEVPEPVEHKRWERDPAYFSPPGGETGLEVMARSVAAVRDAMHGQRTVAVVTHKAPIRLVAAFLLGLPPSRYRDLGCVTVGSVSWLTVTPGGTTLHGLGDSSHLPHGVAPRPGPCAGRHGHPRTRATALTPNARRTGTP